MSAAVTPAPPRRRLRFLQISLRTILIGMTIIAVLLGVVGNWVIRSEQQQNAASDLKKLGAVIVYANRPDDETWWQVAMRERLPGDYCNRVVEVKFPALPPQIIGGNSPLTKLREIPFLPSVYLGYTRLTDAELSPLADVYWLRSLNLAQTSITDEGLLPLANLKRLQELNLRATRISNTGLAHLVGLKKLRTLNLSCTRITNEGLAQLEVFQKLEQLNLAQTPVNDGLAHLHAFPKLRQLDLSGAAITDAGLVHLQSLPALSDLDLGNLPITDAGLANLLVAGPSSTPGPSLAERLEALSLYNTEVTDGGLVHLERLTRLKTLELSGTHITSAGRDRLQTALPNCKISWRWRGAQSSRATK